MGAGESKGAVDVFALCVHATRKRARSVVSAELTWETGIPKTLRFALCFVYPCASFTFPALSAERRPAGQSSPFPSWWSFDKALESFREHVSFRRWSTAAVAPGVRPKPRPTRHEKTARAQSYWGRTKSPACSTRIDGIDNFLQRDRRLTRRGRTPRYAARVERLHYTPEHVNSSSRTAVAGVVVLRPGDAGKT